MCFFSAIKLLLFLVSAIAVAQESNLKFRKLSINDGLSQSFISDIVQDKNGFIWTGTKDGLNRYDGYIFKVYKNVPADKNTISENHISCLHTDANGKLWAGTVNNGLNLYNETTDGFIRIRFDSNNFSGKISCITSKDNRLWVGFADGKIVCFNATANLNTAIKPEIVINSIPSKNGILPVPDALIQDSRNRLWIATATGIWQANLTNKIPQIAQPKYPVYVTTFAAGQKRATLRDESLNPVNIQAMAFEADKNGDIWIVTEYGPIRFDEKKNTFNLYKLWENKDSWENRTHSLTLKTTGNKKELWVGLSNGIGIIDLKTDRFKIYESKDYAGLVKGKVYSVFVERGGSVWFGSNGDGISVYSPALSLFNNALPASPVLEELPSLRSIHSLGFVEVDKTTKHLWASSYIKFLTSTATPKSKRKGEWQTAENLLICYNFCQDWQGTVWMTGYKGFAGYNPRSGQLKYLNPNITYPGFVLADAVRKKIWCSTNRSLILFDPQTKTIDEFVYPFASKSNTETYKRHSYTTICEDPDGTLWIGTPKGLLHFDPLKKTYTKQLAHSEQNSKSLNANEIKCLLNDPADTNILWIGTAGGGLNKYDKAKNAFVNYTEKDGLSNNTVYGILADKAGNLWMSTNKGISVFNTLKGSFRNYDVDNGLQSNEFNTGAYYQSPDGEMFFGGINGFNRFYPEEIFAPHYSPPANIVSITSLAGNNSSILPKNNTIELPYDQNSISISLAALDYSNQDKNRYAYRILELNDNWISTGTQRNITLTGLAPGTYTFQAKTTDAYGEWGNNIASVAIHILPPWWQTVWAKLVYLLIIAGIIYFAWKRQMLRQKEKERLKQQQREAENLAELDALKNRFLTNITHEFRTPLTLIKGQVEMMRGSGLENNYRRLDEIEKSSVRLLELINQLLDLSKLESGAYELVYKHGDLYEEILHLSNMFEAIASQKNITLTTYVSENAKALLPLSNYAYSQEAVITIVSNLLSNACKFTPIGGNINVQADIDEDEVIISVTDSGPGIDKDHLPKIFDRFYQVETSSKRSFEGSGVGLALVKELTTLHNGKISAQSTVGVGTTFTASIRLRYDIESFTTSREAAKITTTSEEYNSIIEISGSNDPDNDLPLILVVEDNPSLRLFICESLGIGYRTVQAENGCEGLLLAAKLIPDLIITDIMMPEMDGFEFCGKIKDDILTCHIPVVMLTAKSSGDSRVTGLEAGADDYLVKPFSVKELRARVQNLIRLRNILREKFSTDILKKPEVATLNQKDTAFLNQLLAIVEHNLSDTSFGVEQLAFLSGMSGSQLNRKLKALSGQSTLKFIKNIRLQKALALLREGSDNITGVAYSTGFDSPGYFTKVFKEHFGVLPSEKEKVESIKIL
ncbi:response regulator [Flavobacterium sp. Sd200]|uniref:hybrid sensor histidine kinase/response regulator transcription factor n=1 Tax=Flavobacterium sp. Sd200 TaxID=2692211 RepID=UPI00136DD14E|nr:ATP-binding protein [Flavobacterium sp. Sd200]MXN90752.1 response regulator [Flavobacterium sp. Sd200]